MPSAALGRPRAPPADRDLPSVLNIDGGNLASPEGQLIGGEQLSGAAVNCLEHCHCVHAWFCKSDEWFSKTTNNMIDLARLLISANFTSS